MNKLSFNKLPRDAQEKLRDLLDPDDDRFVFPRGNSLLVWVGVVLPLGWFAYLIFSTQGALWDEWMFWLMAAATVSAALALVFSVAKILRGALARIKNAYIFTTNEFIKVENNCVESVSLAEIDALTYLETDKALEIWRGERPQKLRVHNAYKAAQLERVFGQWKAQASGSILANYIKPEFAFSSTGKTAGLLAALTVAVLLGLGLSYAAKGMNRVYDDEQSWKAAAGENTVKAYEGYKTRHPQGKYAAESDQQISQLLGKLKDGYFARAKDTADQKAVAAFGSVLESVARDPHLTIYVRINETRELDNKVVDKIRQAVGVTSYSYDQALPASKMDYRKNLVFEKFKFAFGEQINIAPVRFEATGEPPDDKPLIDIDYTMKTEDFYYTFFTVSGGGRQVNYYPGAKFIFNFSLKPGGNAAPFEAKFENLPKTLYSGGFREEFSGNYSFDQVLFGLVSDNFRNHIQAKFGFIDIANS